MASEKPEEVQLSSLDKALELVQAIPASLAARKKLETHPLLPFRTGKSAKSLFDAADAALGKLIPYLTDPRVREAVENLSVDPAVPPVLRAQFKIWLGTPAVNLIGNGFFETEPVPFAPLWSQRLHGRRDTRYASDGKYAFRTANGYYLIHPKIERWKTYLFLCDVFIEKGSGEGRFSMKIGPSRDSAPVSWFQTEIIPTGGSWNTVSSVVSSSSEGVNSLQIQLYFEKFEKDEPVWIDNIRLYCLDDLIQSETSRE